MTRPFFLLLLCCVLPAGAAAAMHAAGASITTPSAGARLAATCVTCHSGPALDGGAMGSLDGMPRAHMLAAFKRLARPGSGATVMPQLLRGYSEAELGLIATHFASRPARHSAPHSTAARPAGAP